VREAATKSRRLTQSSIGSNGACSIAEAVCVAVPDTWYFSSMLSCPMSCGVNLLPLSHLRLLFPPPLPHTHIRLLRANIKAFACVFCSPGGPSCHLLTWVLRVFSLIRAPSPRFSSGFFLRLIIPSHPAPSRLVPIAVQDLGSGGCLSSPWSP